MTDDEKKQKLRIVNENLKKLAAGLLEKKEDYDALDVGSAFIVVGFDVLQAPADMGAARAVAWLKDFADDISRLIPPAPSANA